MRMSVACDGSKLYWKARARGGAEQRRAGAVVHAEEPAAHRERGRGVFEICHTGVAAEERVAPFRFCFRA